MIEWGRGETDRHGIRRYRSADGRFVIVNGRTWETFGAPWKVFAARPGRWTPQGYCAVSYCGRYSTLRAAKARAEEIREEQEQ